MIGMIKTMRLVMVLLASLTCAAQQPSPAGKPTPAPETQVATEPTLDIQTLVKETEQVDMRRRKIGIFWWVPPEFWEISLRQQGYDSEQARKVFQPFKNYNLFMISVGDLGPGNVTWAKDPDLKKKVRLRDARGNPYKPLPEVPQDISLVVELMRPIFKNMMGNFGEGLQFEVFPVKDGAGNVFADAHKQSEIYLDVTDMMGSPMSTYTWRFPLTALSAPKHCPVGKEKVEANWKYCPWHGNKLEDQAAKDLPASAK